MNNFISKRLLTIADMIEDGKIVYDVGCDHAYLDIFLMQRRQLECYAIDVRPSVVAIAKKNIENCQLKIPVLLNNGLENIEIKNNSVVVIAGMGTRTILKIVKDKKIDEMIVQSNDDLPLLRLCLSEFGYQISDERVVFEAGYFYVLIKFKQGSITYTEDELLLGPVLMTKERDSIYIEYLNYLIKKYNKMIKNVPKNILKKRRELENKKNIIINYLEKQNKK